ncbi:putative calpain-like cysteine peptidase putativecysteine peptidase Clan CA family C2 [Leptomonas pyrrhocoris]|uniref:Putative calpain-like cysteine peptidase putativecysteine peptidase Clan CA family C2 n=1 Tax=Leptomonas pyrrhocoris TaxID=157538 RepID=A0A0M9G8E8_LEPPY|nr:putative calpain-like cysteine peptidase putativecysteine peptidase Clan CA family C2 [Leptomonas pyrrhocoris]KPA84773.1 putative calpain-like cysteine peptidase putativecysteine peptidase Clan CA family C2 [Leptomonas pyrrhocoris]|eukprot:XP_015663212.1 putative calpain-like cysteine peptidase putativecysteine peptidase Clan CA family C2 [Leptomonas pyrrhocoris]
MPRKALLGNWFEEEAYERDRRRLMQGRSGGVVEASKEVANMMAKVKHHNTPHAIAPIPADGFLRFYVPLMLQNANTCGFLSVDLDDRKATTTGWQVACSTAPAEEATLRCTVVMVPAAMPPTDSFPIPEDEEDMVHYGQPFYLMTVRELCPDPLFLISEAVSPGNASHVSGKLQHVYFSPDGGGAEAMWCIDDANPAYQEDSRDHPVRAEDVIRVRHNMTNTPLASLKETFYNDFGQQYEVGCGKLTLLSTRKRGGPPVKENLWMFIHDGQGQQQQQTQDGAEGGMESTSSSPQTATAAP